ncbi:hypothetical protein GEMRC1_000810 [Eukaryota sp. GEM-RC1]
MSDHLIEEIAELKTYNQMLVKILITTQPKIFRTLPDKCKNDIDIVKHAISCDCDNYEFCNLKDNEEIIIHAIENNYKKIDDTLVQGNMKILKASITNNWNYYQGLPKELKCNKEIIEFVMKTEPVAIDMIPEELYDFAADFIDFEMFDSIKPFVRSIYSNERFITRIIKEGNIKILDYCNLKFLNDDSINRIIDSITDFKNAILSLNCINWLTFTF